MQITALVSFCGTVTMAPGETREVDNVVATNLINCGYAKKTETVTEADTSEAPTPIKKGRKTSKDA